MSVPLVIVHNLVGIELLRFFMPPHNQIPSVGDHIDLDNGQGAVAIKSVVREINGDEERIILGLSCI